MTISIESRRYPRLVELDCVTVDHAVLGSRFPAVMRECLWLSGGSGAGELMADGIDEGTLVGRTR